MRTKVAASLALFVLASAVPVTTGAAQDIPPPPPTARVAWEGAFFGFDPKDEYHYGSWQIYTSLLLRTLVSYPHRAGAEGNELVADIATEVPQPTGGGLTYTFTLKPGVMFGPPLNREVTSHDIEYAFRRMTCRNCYASYSFYYFGVIEGMRRNNPGDISGIETPDDRTIVFHLKEPTGDFLHRLAMPATAPVPREVARCFTQPTRRGSYGNRLVATGPYMIAGSENLDVASGCEGMRHISGYRRRSQRLTLERNPNYDPATDDPYVREPVFERFVFRKMTPNDAFDAIEEGRLDAALMPPSPQRVARYMNDSSEYPVVHSNPEDVTWYITMNLTRRPFDDVHVRRAFNFAIDKRPIAQAWGGDTFARLATHILPPDLTAGHPTAEEYDPYGALDGPDLDAARAEMALSPYDSNEDGACDAPACDSVILMNRDKEPWLSAETAVVDALEAIGIEPRVRRLPIAESYNYIGDISRGIHLGMNPGWAKDYSDARAFMEPLFHSSSIQDCYFTTNYSLVGGTPELKERCRAPGDFGDLPNVDADIENCAAIADEAQRDECWIDLDAKLMEEVVPWVPLVWRNSVRVTGPGIGHYEFDQFTGQISLAHIRP